MNLTGRKSEGQVLHWKPFATSTPLKLISSSPKNQIEIHLMKPAVFVAHLSQKLPGVSKNFRNKESVEKKNRTAGKKRLKTFFDLSSSSDDENDDYLIGKSRPIIKLGTANTNKVNLVATNQKPNTRINVAKNQCSNKTSDNTKRPSKKCNPQGSPENIVENESVSNSDVENVHLNSIKETNLPGTVTKLSPENKKCLSKALRVLQNSKKVGKKPRKLISKNSMLKVSSENNNTESSQNLLKRTYTKSRNTVVKKSRQNWMVSNEKQQMSVDKTTKSSHQLFTDSTQEELINTLCLISPENDALDVNIGLSRVIRKSFSNTKTNNELKHRKKIECEGVKEIENAIEKKERPKRTRQPPQNYWVVNDKHKPTKDKAKGTKKVLKKGTKIVEVVTKCELVQPLNNSAPSSSLDAMAAKTLKIAQSTSETTEVPIVQGDVNTGNEEQVKGFDSMCTTNGPSYLYTKDGELPAINTKSEKVFLPLNEISYLENEFGQQISQVCSMKNFKCGVFKLKPGCNFTWKKCQRNNYMGGVLIKGEMQMTIGGSERTLHEGDMVLVPPLSECQVNNTGECDFIFYYWCKFIK